MESEDTLRPLSGWMWASYFFCKCPALAIPEWIAVSETCQFAH